MPRAAHSLRELRFALLIPVVLTVAVATAGAAPAGVRAQDNVAAVERVTALNKRALDAYNNLEFEDARKLLKQALDLCNASGLDKHPIKARTHVHMGVVLIATKQQELGIKQFRKALELQPDIQMTKSLANPEIMQAFDEARSGGGGSGGGSSAADARGDADGRSPRAGPQTSLDEPAEGAGIRHSPVTRGRRGAPLTVSASVGADVPAFAKLVIAYRAEGASDFLPADMKPSGNRYVGQIPESATRGNRVAYYIEAEADDETAVASSGSEDRPFIVSLSGARVARNAEGEEEVGVGGGERGEGGFRGPAAVNPIFVSLLGGTGIGYTTGNGEVNADNKVTAGFAPSTAAQVVIEGGYFLNRDWRLSLQLRYQFVAGTTPLYLQKLNPPKMGCGSDNICTPASSAVAVAARSSWFFGGGALRPYFSLAVAGGQIRHVVTFNQSPKVCGPMGTDACVDTVKSGPAFAGAGGGAILTLTPVFGIVGEVNGLLGFPDFTAHFDINLGLAARF